MRYKLELEEEEEEAERDGEGKGGEREGAGPASEWMLYVRYKLEGADIDVAAVQDELGGRLAEA